MRLWSIHPKYLDEKGLVALWREALLARKVLRGETIGYKNHPQLERFRKLVEPINAINFYLGEIWHEAKKRNYNFDENKIDWGYEKIQIPITKGQVEFEFNHLLNKLKTRDKKRYEQLINLENKEVHPIFIIVSGEVESWEKITNQDENKD